METTPAKYEFVDFDEVEGIDCACGLSRRAFLESRDSPLSMHRVEISLDAKTHYHKTLTEVYYFLECADDAQIELDGELHPVRAGMAVLIHPGVRHRAVGRMTILLVCLPKHDPADEWFD